MKWEEEMKEYAKIGAYKLSFWLKDRLDSEGFNIYSRILESNVTKEMLMSVCRYELDYNRYYTEEIIIRYKNVFEQCKDNLLALTCVELAFLEYKDYAVNELFSMITGNLERGVSLELVAKIVRPDTDIMYLSNEIIQAKKIIEKILVLENVYTDIIRNTYRVDSALIYYLNGNNISDICNEMDISGSNTTILNQGKNFGNKVIIYDFHDDLEDSILLQNEINEISDEIIRIMKNDELCPVVHIIGEKLSGKKFTIRHISKKLGHNLLVYRYLEEEEDGEIFARIIQKLKRTLILTNSALCIDIVANDKSCDETVLKIISELKDEKEIYIASDKIFKIVPYVKNVVCQMEIKKPNDMQSFMIWQTFINKYLGADAANKIDIQELAVKINVATGNVKKIVHHLKYANKDNIYNEKYISKISNIVLNDGKYDDIKHIESTYSWDDLKLSPMQKNILNDIYSHVKYKFKVYQEYGLIQHFQYGRCVSVLFSGASGTGKTMAAYVLANMLHMELYKVELSKVVDKYIGETQKRLEEIFKKAENSNMILFFDEADALFAKRSEVNDSKDKHSNMEVAYILQRIEDFDGIIILSTNYRENVDTAFMRRIKFEVRFSMPTKEIREEVWRSVLGGQVVTDVIDYKFLAKNFKFSGAIIKNIALNAVFKAVSQNKAVAMEHILWAIQVEFEKTGKMVFKDEFGRYGYLIEKIEKEFMEKKKIV